MSKSAGKEPVNIRKVVSIRAKVCDVAEEKRKRSFRVTQLGLTTLMQLEFFDKPGGVPQTDVTLEYTGTFKIAIGRDVNDVYYYTIIQQLRKMMYLAALGIFEVKDPAWACRDLRVKHNLQWDGGKYEKHCDDCSVYYCDVYSSRPGEVFSAMKALERENVRK